MDRRKRLKLAIVSACATGSGLEQIMNQCPTAFGLEIRETHFVHEYRNCKYEEEEEELNSLFFHSAMLSSSLGLSSDAGWWVKPRVPAWFDRFLNEVYDKESWIKALRMSRETFMWICSELQPLLDRKITRFRYPIPLQCRVGAALYRLVSGVDLQIISNKFGIGVSSSQRCVTDTIKAIIQHFGGRLSWPEGTNMDSVLNGFFSKCDLPNCMGAIGKMNIHVMPSSGLDVANCSVTLQAVCDSSYRFLDVYCGSSSSRNSNSSSSSSRELVENSGLGAVLSGENGYLVGDDSYPLLAWLLVPYRGAELPEMEASFNRKHELGVVHIRDSFVILKKTFTILSKCVKHSISLVPKLLTACCILHNLLLDRNEIAAVTAAAAQEQQLTCELNGIPGEEEEEEEEEEEDVREFYS